MNDFVDSSPTQPDAAPAGMWLNSFGDYTPISAIKPQRKLEDQLVRDLVSRAEELRAKLAAFRQEAFGEADVFLELLAEQYGAKRGGERGNVTFESFDGLRRVQIATGDFMSFGPSLQTAKNLIDECLTRWAEGSGDELRAIVNQAFDVGKEGKIRVDRILALRQLKIDDPTWLRAMEAISDALKVTKSKRYIRFYQRPNLDVGFTAISLDIASVVP